jgi:methionine-rich copper-binding protein CopC
MRKSSRSLIVLAAILVGLSAYPAILSAHLKLARSNPAPNATLDVAPSQLQLWFSEEPLLVMTSVALTGPNGAVKLDKPRAGGERSLIVSIAAPLDAGAYKIAWKTAGDDGHSLQGTVDFSVKGKPAPASK